jgi:hypothetical protein
MYIAFGAALLADLREDAFLLDALALLLAISVHFEENYLKKMLPPGIPELFHSLLMELF